jgi:hypothetical protein
VLPKGAMAQQPAGLPDERWFGLLTDKQLRRGTHRSIQALEADIRAWIEQWNTDPNPSHGPRPPTKSSNDSPHIFNEFPAQDIGPTRSWSIS